MLDGQRKILSVWRKGGKPGTMATSAPKQPSSFFPVWGRGAAPLAALGLVRRLVVVALMAGWVAAQTGPAPEASARAALDDLLAQRFPELIARFNTVMKENLTLEVLRSRVSSELSGFGKAEHVGEPILAQDGDMTLVSFPVDFSSAKINVQFHVEKSGQLAAIHFRPRESPLPPVWTHPSYSKAEKFHEREVVIGADPWKLGGTLTVPAGKGPFPGLILVHGPGPDDRDETMRANKVFADIAEGLSSRGIAVLRYDKRTRVYGRQMSESEFTLREETIDDALSAAAVMRRQPEVDAARVYLLGHSLGGYAAPRIAKEDGQFAGIIFLAANARPIEELVLEQTKYLAGAGVLPPDVAQKRMETLKVEIEKVKALAPGAANPPVVLGLPSAWLLDVKNYHPAEEARPLSMPMLFLEGERDFQVTMKDFDCWKSALGGRSNVSFHSYPDLNHLFIAGQGPSLPAEYLVPGHVSSAVIDAIADWISAPKH